MKWITESTTSSVVDHLLIHGFVMTNVDFEEQTGVWLGSIDGKHVATNQSSNSFNSYRSFNEEFNKGVDLLT